MKLASTPLLLALAAGALSACAAVQPHLSADFGQASAANMREMIAYPAARRETGPARVASGDRAALAMDRYATGRVVITPNVAASKVGATGNGAQSGQ